MTTASAAPEVYGLLAEFDKPEDVVAATRQAHAHGYRFMEAYTPFPVEGLAEALGFERNGIARVVLIGGVIGGLGGFFMQWYSAVVHFPLDVGGRPFNSWPSFMPITFELTILIASLSAVFGMLSLNGLPRPHHPVFNVPGLCWRRATGSFCACRRATRCLTSWNLAAFSRITTRARSPWCLSESPVRFRVTFQ